LILEPGAGLFADHFIEASGGPPTRTNVVRNDEINSLAYSKTPPDINN
jgi:hypothetical protein